MLIDNFKLAKYRRTVGHEGEAFTASLQYMGKPVADYADYADGGPPQVRMDKGGWGQEPLLKTIQAIHDAVGLEFLKADNPESCTEYLCQILDEGRDIDSLYKKLAKNYPNDHVGIVLTGSAWTAAPFDADNYETGRIFAVSLSAPDGQVDSAREQLRDSISKYHEKGDFQKLSAFFVLEPGTAAPLSLTSEAYIQAFTQGKELQQSLDNNGSEMGMRNPTQG